MTAPPPAIQVDGAHKAFGAAEVLRGIDLTLPVGARLALAGENGAGKTTLIKLILGLASPDRGSARLFGREAADPEARRSVAYLPERLVPPPRISGEAFLHWALGVRGEAFQRREGAALLEALGADPARLDQRVETLSRGTVRKLGLAAALLGNPRLLILDEPMSGLDPGARLRLKRVLARSAAAGTSLLFSTHHLADAEELAGTLAILHRGEVRFSGPPADCRARYGADSLEGAFFNCLDEVG